MEIARTFNLDDFDSYFKGKPMEFSDKTINGKPKLLGKDEILIPFDQVDMLKENEFKLLWFTQSYENIYDGSQERGMSVFYRGPFKEPQKDSKRSLSVMVHVDNFPLTFEPIEYFTYGTREVRFNKDHMDNDKLRKVREDAIKTFTDEFVTMEIETRNLYRGYLDKLKGSLVEIECNESELPTLVVRGFGPSGIKREVDDILELKYMRKRVQKDFPPSIYENYISGFGYNIPELNLATNIKDLIKMNNIIL